MMMKVGGMIAKGNYICQIICKKEKNKRKLEKENFEGSKFKKLKYRTDTQINGILPKC